MEIKLTYALLTLGMITAITYFIAKPNAENPSSASYQANNPISVSKQPEVANHNIELRLKKLANLIKLNQQANIQKLQEVQTDSLEIRNQLVDLQNRLEGLEGINVMSDSEQTNPEAGTDIHGNNLMHVTEKELGHWVEETFVDGFDPTATSQAMAEAEQSLENFPGVYLNDMQCSDRFCRATLSHADANKIAAEDMFGQPPFVTDGFTMIEPDGSLLFYFSQPGESIKELREELLVGFDYN
jgi:hypothetical protein